MNSEKAQEKIDLEQKKLRINKVANRFLPLTESVLLGLEQESKISDFNIIRQIGEGSFGKVYLVKHNKTGSEYAVKQINKLNKNNQEGKPYFRREIEIMYKIHQCNVVKLYNHFEDNENCYFVMEYVEKGNLFSQPSWKKNHCFTSFEVAKIIKEVICAVYYLHNMDPPIIHRDIKPENVLIDKDGIAKITDFGWSNYVDSKEIRSTYCGTPVYLAPEMITEIGHDEHLDIWCIGVLLFELLTGNVPFRGKDLQSLNNNILSLKISWPKDINLDAKNLILKILKPDPEERISLIDMLKHPFFTKKLNDENLYKSLIKPDGIKYPPFLMSEYSIENYDKMIKEKIKYNKENVNTNSSEGEKVNIFQENKNQKSMNEDVIKKPSTEMTNNPYNSIQSFGDFSKEDLAESFFVSNTNSIKGSNPINDNNTNFTTEITPGNSINQKSLQGDSNININQLYSNLMKDYEKLTTYYNEILLSKSEQSQKLEECSQKINLLLKEKTSLIQEIEEKSNEKLKLKTELEETKQELKEKLAIIENYKNNNGVKNISNGENTSQKEGNINTDYNEMIKLFEEKDEEIKKLKEKIIEIEKNNLSKNDKKNEEYLNDFRNSINHLSHISTEMKTNQLNSNDNKKLVEQMEENLKNTKLYFEEEIKKLQSDFQKDKEKFNLIIKIKDEEILKLVKNKETIKNQEAKKYEKIISKYEQLVKEKETEIEILKLKNKKLTLVNKSYQAKKSANGEK